MRKGMWVYLMAMLALFLPASSLGDVYRARPGTGWTLQTDQGGGYADVFTIGVTGALSNINLSSGGAIGGTWTGTPTWSGVHTFNGRNVHDEGADTRILFKNSTTSAGQIQATSNDFRFLGLTGYGVSLWAAGASKLSIDAAGTGITASAPVTFSGGFATQTISGTPTWSGINSYSAGVTLLGDGIPLFLDGGTYDYKIDIVNDTIRFGRSGTTGARIVFYQPGTSSTIQTLQASGVTTSVLNTFQAGATVSSGQTLTLTGVLVPIAALDNSESTYPLTIANSAGSQTAQFGAYGMNATAVGYTFRAGGADIIDYTGSTITLSQPVTSTNRIAFTAGGTSAAASVFHSASNKLFVNGGTSGGVLGDTAGNGIIAWDASTITLSKPTYLPDGSATVPSFSFTSDTDTGIYSDASNILSFTAGGVRGAYVTALGVAAANGAVGTPAFRFINDSDTGWYLNAAGDTRLAVGGADVIQVASGAVTFSGAVTKYTATAAAAAAGQIGLYSNVLTHFGGTSGHAFADDAGASVGGITDAGAWTLGPASATQRQTINGYIYLVGNAVTRPTSHSFGVFVEATGSLSGTTNPVNLSTYSDSSKLDLSAGTTSGYTHGISIQARSDGDKIAFYSRNVVSGEIGATGTWYIGPLSQTSGIQHLIQSTKNATYRHVLSVDDRTEMTTGVGGGIVFRGDATSAVGASLAEMAGLEAYKENATTANYAASLRFFTSNSAGTFAEKGRVNSSGAWTIGTTSLGSLTHTLVTGGNTIVDVTSSSASGNSTLKITAGATGVPYLEFFKSTSKQFSIEIPANLIVYDADQSHCVYLAQNSNSWTSCSDARLKTDVSDIGYGLDEVVQLRPVSYRGVNSPEEGPTLLGLIAQEVESVIPEVVTEITPGQEDSLKGVDYTSLIPVLIKSIQEVKVQLNCLRDTPDAQESQCF